MPTVIDELVVELGLDATKFKKQEKETEDSFAKTKDKAQKTAGEIEHSSKGVTETLGKLQRGILGVAALLVGGMGLKEFASYLVKTEADTGRMAKTLDTSVRSLSSWQGAVKQVGGTAEGITGSIQHLVNEFQMFSLTGESSVIPYFRALGIDIADAGGHMRKMDDILLDLADRFHKLDPAKAAAIGRAMGLDQGTINLLLQGRDAVKSILEQQKEIGVVTDEDAKAAIELQKAWAGLEARAISLGRALLTLSTPAILKALGLLRTFMTPSAPGAQVDALGNVVGTEVDAYGKPLTSGSGTPAAPAKAATGARGTMSKAETEAYIRQAAIKRGIDPEQALRVARSEGLNSYSGDLDATGKPTSFGPFQLHYPGIGRNTADGLGSKFTKQTGLNASDPSTVRQQIDFALDQAANGGWGPWHGWRGSPWAGISGRRLSGMPSVATGAGAAVAGAGGGSTTSHQSETHIGTINVNTNATDADGIARDIKPAIERNQFMTQGNYGAN